MRFSVTETFHGRRGRLGNISGLRMNSGEQSLDTPTCLLYTQAGSVPHLTCGMLHKIGDAENLPALFPLPLIASFAESVAQFGKGLANFVALPSHPSFVRIQDPMTTTPTGFNDRAGVSVWNQGGRIHLNPVSFTRMMEAFQPTCYQALCDSDTPKDTSRKRLQHAVDRSISLLDQCLNLKGDSSCLQNSAILGSIQGGYSKDFREASAKETAKRDVDGFVIEGLHINGPQTKSLKFEEVAQVLDQVIALLPEDKPRFLHGVLRPEFILRAVLRGIDVFDASFAHAATEAGCALVFSYSSKKDLMLMVEGDLLDQELQMDMKDCRHQEDFVPLLGNCACYACANFTRAYVHHLLNTGEMLGQVLLSLHNIHHFLGFVKSICKFLPQYHPKESNSH
ncbi:unnamed protein product [Ixodes hexagonus]